MDFEFGRQPSGGSADGGASGIKAGGWGKRLASGGASVATEITPWWKVLDRLQSGCGREDSIRNNIKHKHKRKQRSRSVRRNPHMFRNTASISPVREG